MDLLLLRHADALDHASSDLARPLSEKGHRQAKKVAQHLAGSKLKPELILSSPAVRTLETAQPVGEALGLSVLPCPWAQPGMHPEDALSALKDYRGFDCVLLVGHQPDISFLAARLLGHNYPERLHVTKASLMHLHLFSNEAAELKSFLPCNLI